MASEVVPAPRCCAIAFAWLKASIPGFSHRMRGKKTHMKSHKQGHDFRAESQDISLRVGACHSLTLNPKPCFANDLGWLVTR